MDRQLSIFEQFDQMMVTQSNRDHFKVLNTNPMPDFVEENGQWVGICRIRYNGKNGKDKNTWGLR